MRDEGNNCLANGKTGDEGECRNMLWSKPLDREDNAHQKVLSPRRFPDVVETSASRGLVVGREDVAVQSLVRIEVRGDGLHLVVDPPDDVPIRVHREAR